MRLNKAMPFEILWTDQKESPPVTRSARCSLEDDAHALARVLDAGKHIGLVTITRY